MRNFKKTFIGDAKFYRLLFIVVIPIIVQTGITNFVSLLDNIMVGQTGTNQMTGVAIANQLMMVFNLCIFGAISGAGIFGAQYYGKGDQEGVRYAFRFKLVICLLMVGIGFLVFLPFGKNLIHLYLTADASGTDAAETLHYGHGYLYIMLVGMIPFAIGQAYSSTLRECGETMLPMKAGIAAVLVNLLFNFLLIFGKFGMPALGVEGAAISTAFARGVSMVILFVILFRKHIPRFPLSYFCPFPFVELKNLLKIGVPSAGENMSYSFSQVVLTYFINMLGNEALATRTYVVNIVMFVYLFAIAMAQGGAICIGHLVGERKIHAAYLLGKYVMRISILVSLVLSCIWALMGHTLFSWLTDNPEIIRLGTIILFIDVILEVGRAINIYATNALRATGDVNYPFYVGFVVQWSVAVGCGFLFGIHWGWGLVGMWCAFVLDENLRGIIFVQRWNSLKWTKKGFVK